MPLGLMLMHGTERRMRLNLLALIRKTPLERDFPSRNGYDVLRVLR